MLTTLSLLFAAAFAAQDTDAPAALEPIALTVEYVGDPATPRGKAFVALLEEHFTSVEAVDAKQLGAPADSAQRFAGADVLLVDADLTGHLPDGYGKPMVVISGLGVRTAEGLGAKLDWL
ncbi:MAG: hypothetical protein H6831_00420 [Planctomycetes bacterium]|nr:hypothetical protein [Planctomycetota bacterium]MCB9902850.1 hypothetical protein [Planctomycetota bacterium]